MSLVCDCTYLMVHGCPHAAYSLLEAPLKEDTRVRKDNVPLPLTTMLPISSKSLALEGRGTLDAYGSQAATKTVIGGQPAQWVDGGDP
ncbi:unnamed protein product [Strongylus vulgaris]|uniref:Uncharacterized protein n=1 Tax=Strongylus vulgaris TaxID=40348 RepID=A0A3P7IQA6_STRVU|nr:unnamed protein product [Strongylus vulgaris]